MLRELTEELRFTPAEDEAVFLHDFEIAAELEEGTWVSIAGANELPLAPFTRDHVLPNARRLCAQRRTARCS